MMNIRPLTYILALASYLVSAQSVIEGCWKTLYDDIDSSASNIALKEMSFANSSNYFLIGYDRTNANRTTTSRLSIYNQDGRYYNIDNLSNVPSFDTYQYTDYRHVYSTYDDFTISGRGEFRSISYVDHSGISIPAFAYSYGTASTKPKFLPRIESYFYNNTYFKAYKKGDSVVVDDDNIRNTPLIFTNISYAEYDFVVTDGITATTPSYHILSTVKDGIEVNSLVYGKAYVQGSKVLDIKNEKFKVLGYQKGLAYILAYLSNELSLYRVNLSDYSYEKVSTTFDKLISPNFDFKMLNSGQLSIAYLSDSKVNVSQYNIAKDAFAILLGKKAKLSSTSHVAVSMDQEAHITIAYENNKIVSFDYFTPAPVLPKPIIQSLAMGFSGTTNPVLLKKGNTFVHCFAPLFGEEAIDIKFANLSAGVDTVTMIDKEDNIPYKIEKTQYPTAFTNNFFEFYPYSVASYTMTYSNSCFKSDTLFFRIVAQNFTVTETPSVLGSYCQNSTANLSIPAKVEWITGGYSFQTPTLDTLVIATTTTPVSIRKFSNVSAVAANQIPFDNNLASTTYRIYKTVTSTLGCSFTGTAKSFVIYKSPESSILSLSRAVNKKLLPPSVNGSISDTLLYFPWESKTAAIGLQPTFDNTHASLVGTYQIGSLITQLTTGKSFLFAPDTALAQVSNNKSKSIDIKLNSFNVTDPLKACSAAATYKFLLKKVSFNDLNLRIIGDSIIKPGNLYPYGIYASDVTNKLASGNYKFKWRVYDINDLTTPVGKRTVELIDTTTLINTNKVLGKVSGKYVLKAEIYVVGANADKLIGTLNKNFEVKTTQVVVTGTGSTIDPNRLGSDLCRVDTFMCSGLYLKSVSFSNLSQNRGTCTNTPTVDNTGDSSKFIKVFTGENYQFSLTVGDEYSISDQDSAKILVIIDYDNDGKIGEDGEFFTYNYDLAPGLTSTNSIANRPEYIGDKRLSIILSRDEVQPGADLCELINTPGNIREDFLIHIEAPAQLLVSSFVSPNGDGKNDYLEINGVDERFSTNLKVFNKFGINMYEKDGVGRSDYKSDGFERNLKPDTYYYYFENGSTTVKGFFEIK